MEGEKAREKFQLLNAAARSMSSGFRKTDIFLDKILSKFSPKREINEYYKVFLYGYPTQHGRETRSGKRHKTSNRTPKLTLRQMLVGFVINQHQHLSPEKLRYSIRCLMPFPAQSMFRWVIVKNAYNLIFWSKLIDIPGMPYSLPTLFSPSGES